jgi:hypothetical protein
MAGGWLLTTRRLAYTAFSFLPGDILLAAVGWRAGKVTPLMRASSFPSRRCGRYVAVAAAMVAGEATRQLGVYDVPSRMPPSSWPWRAKNGVNTVIPRQLLRRRMSKALDLYQAALQIAGLVVLAIILLISVVFTLPCRNFSGAGGTGRG